MSGHYILDGHEPKLINTDSFAGLMRWGKFMQHGERRVAADLLCGGVRVSTVFLGLDHGFSLFNDPGHRPVLFETMIFGGRDDGECHRYCTWAEAERGHYHCTSRVRYNEGRRGYSRSHWRKIRRSVLMAEFTNVIQFPTQAAA